MRAGVNKTLDYVHPHRDVCLGEAGVSAGVAVGDQWVGLLVAGGGLRLEQVLLVPGAGQVTESQHLIGGNIIT